MPKKKVTLSIDEDLIKELKKKSIDLGVTLSDYIVMALKNFKTK